LRALQFGKESAAWVAGYGGNRIGAGSSAEAGAESKPVKCQRCRFFSARDHKALSQMIATGRYSIILLWLNFRREVLEVSAISNQLFITFGLSATGRPAPCRLAGRIAAS
jgi:hypothetical protein